MRTEELIKVLSADAELRQASFGRAWSLAIAAAVVSAAAVFGLALGPRPDFGLATHTLHFLFKFVVTIALAAVAFAAMRVAAWPDADPRKLMPYLAVAPALVVGGVLLELLAVPSGSWVTKLVGTNYLVCMTFIPLIGLAPLALFLLALRHGAPSRPGLAGALAGLAAGGIAATFYAAHCPDDSPLFVATWYTIAVLMLTVLGALGGRWAVRW